MCRISGKMRYSAIPQIRKYPVKFQNCGLHSTFLLSSQWVVFVFFTYGCLKYEIDIEELVEEKMEEGGVE